MRTARLAVFFVAGAALVGCAAARQEPGSPSAPAQPEGAGEAPASLEAASPQPIASLDEAEALFAQALAALGGAPGAASKAEVPAGAGAGAPAGARPESAPPPAAPPAERAAPKRAATGADGDAREDDAPAAQAAPDCRAACQAFASLERAVEAICRLAGDPSERCERARRVRDEKSAQVAACECARPR